ncbi:MAG: hypothetical protein IIY21_27315 [Clostridiales bacterium]|nr:hypothetical protein [Clostridiales bacterium]MBQ1572904.1 hypothetical protein [Clostridiales bacterium]
MAQLSIYYKQKHHSNKDVTVSIGEGRKVNFTFRNNSWQTITESEYIRIWAEGNKIKFGDGLTEKKGRKYKLFCSKSTDARYISFPSNVLPEVYTIIEKKVKEDGSLSFNLADLNPSEEVPKPKITNRDRLEGLLLERAHLDCEIYKLMLSMMEGK